MCEGIPQSEILSIPLFKRENSVGNRFFLYCDMVCLYKMLIFYNNLIWSFL